MNCTCTLAQRMVGDGCEACNPSKTIELLQQRVQELEAQLANTEQLTCDGCIWYHKDTMDGCQSPYYNCVRNTNLQDRYKPKDTQ